MELCIFEVYLNLYLLCLEPSALVIYFHVNSDSLPTILLRLVLECLDPSPTLHMAAFYAGSSLPCSHSFHHMFVS